jgi:hypothetical protein
MGDARPGQEAFRIGQAEVRFDQGRWWLIERAPLPSTCSVQMCETVPALTLEVGGPSLAALAVASGSGLRPTE